MRKLIFFCILSASTILHAQSLLIGVTQYGGKDGNGTIFSTDSNGLNMQTPWSFPYIHGTDPKNTLTEYSGKLFGHFYNGIFTYDLLSDKYSVEVSFVDSTQGKDPISKLVLSPSGYFYGTTNAGGPFGCGCLFKYDPAINQIQTLFAFHDTLGCNSTSDLIIASNGKIYGTTSSGGKYGNGALFEYDIASSMYKVLQSFHDIYTGENPQPNGPPALVVP